MSTTSPDTLGAKVFRYCLNRCNSSQKKLVFLTSLIATALNLREPEERFVDNINRALNLSKSRGDGLQFPVWVKSVIWRDRSIFESEFQVLMSRADSDLEKKAAALSIVEKSPTWLKYADPQEMVGDILKYFKYHHDVSLA